MNDYIKEFKDAVPKAIAQAWSDPSFDTLLLSNPKKAFASLGVTLPADMDLRMVKSDSADASNWTLSESNGRSVMTIPLPPAPGGKATGSVSANASSSSSSICCTG
jgi:ribosomally synthesized peptide (two-chain TOMM family)